MKFPTGGNQLTLRDRDPTGLFGLRAESGEIPVPTVKTAFVRYQVRMKETAAGESFVCFPCQFRKTAGSDNKIFTTRPFALDGNIGGVFVSTEPRTNLKMYAAGPYGAESGEELTLPAESAEPPLCPRFRQASADSFRPVVWR